MKKILKLPYLFYVALFAGLIEIIEVIRGTCGVWPQEFALLAILALLALLPSQNKLFNFISALAVLGFYIHEIEEQFFKNEVCSISANELNFLLAAVLLTTIGIFWNLKNKKK